jgi:hypothetical protein
VRRRWLGWVALLVVCAVALGARVSLIERTLPYPRHVDEPLISRTALRVIQTGSFHPESFMRPALPAYVAAGAFAVGYLSAVRAGGLRRLHEIRSVGYPFYSPRRVVRPARVLFAVASVIGLALAALIAFELTGSALLLPLVPLLLSLSTLYFHLSWAYLNPDVLGCALAMGAIYYALQARGRSESWAYPASLGLLGGLAIAAKYNFAPIAISTGLAVCCYRERARIQGIVALSGWTVLGFLLGAPFTVLDLPQFLQGLGDLIAAYGGTGSAHEGSRWSYVAQELRRMSFDFGAASLAPSALGIVVVARRDWRRACVLLGCPLGALFLMSGYGRLNYPRNLITMYVAHAIFLAIGLEALCAWLCRRMAASPVGERHPRGAPAAAVVVIAAAFLVGIPWRRIADAYSVEPDGRNLAVRWLKANVPPDAIVIVGEELGIDVGSLRGTHRIVDVEARSLEGFDGARYADAILLAPHFAAVRPPFAANADRANRQLSAVAPTVIARFGAENALFGYSRWVPWGDPVVEIRRVSAGG